MAKAGRNDPCPCGSGNKFKKCCEAKTLKRGLSADRVSLHVSKSAGLTSLFQANISPLDASRLSVKPSVFSNILSSPKAELEENRNVLVDS